MKIKCYYVYILRCSDRSYYVGFSNNPYRRLDEHNTGLKKTSYTYRRRPVKLVYVETFFDPLEGIAFEKQVKGWSRKKKEALIRGKRHLLPALSKSKTKTPSTRSGSGPKK